MKILSAIAILTLPLQSLGLQGEFDRRYGHVNPSCEDAPITNMVTLDELVSQQRKNENSNDPVTIPCGFRATAVHGNAYSLTSGLEVLGELKFEDKSNSDKETILEAPYILVRGHLQAGTIDQPFESKLRFVLTEFKNFPNTHHNLTVDHDKPNKFFNHSMNFGDKAFVVYGGTISLCGPLEKKKIIAKLAKNVKRGGTTTIDVMGKWNKHWKSGDHLVITSTRYIRGDRGGTGAAREFSLSSAELIKSKRKKITRLWLNDDFDIDPIAVTDFSTRQVKTTDYKGKERNTWMRAEIFKLTRNIVIQGIPVGSDMTEFIGAEFIRTGQYYNLKQNPRGGHFVVAHTPKKQIIQGVEFAAMGQPGILGRYPLHFHSCGNVDSGTVVKYNSIHHSKQRCVVAHATNGLTIKNNVAFWAHDQCYMTEDGYEHSNKFIGNMAANIQRAAYWMANPSNDLIRNIAANSGTGFDYGFNEDDGMNGNPHHFSYKHKIPCQTGGLENDQGCTYASLIPMGKFTSNVAHNLGTAILIYPPRFKSYGLKMNDIDTLNNFFAWNVQTVFDSISSNIQIEGLKVIGASTGLDIHSGNNILVKYSIFQEVCRGVRISDNDRWNRMHSGVEVKRVVFNEVWEKSDNCAPIVLRTESNSEKQHGYTKPTVQIKNVNLYKVKKLFSLDSDGIKNNIRQYGFFVHNVLSHDSPLADIAPKINSDDEYLPTYVIRHGNPGNLIEDVNNSLMNNCKISTIGGYPNSDEFFVCEDQCWRAVAIMFKQVLGNNDSVSLKFISDSGNIFVIKESERKALNGSPCPPDYIHIIQVIPSGNYKISLVDSEMKVLSKDLHDVADIRFYHADQRFDGFEFNLNNYGCLANVTLEFNGNNIEYDDFGKCSSYYG